MLTQLILPIATIHTTLNLALEHVGASLVDFSMAIEISPTFERAVTGGTSGVCWGRLSCVERNGIGNGIDSVSWERFRGCDGGSVLGGELVCREVALVAVAVGASGKWIHHGE